MTAAHSSLLTLIQAIGVDDDAVLRVVASSPALVKEPFKEGATRQTSREYFLESLEHYVYAGDTLLHIAAAAYRSALVQTLIEMGAEVGARNRRGATPLHYAVDGGPGARRWNPSAQAATVACLIARGADPNAADANGTTPLHRAVRNRCAAAVRALLDGGADVQRPNKRGSRPLQLASWNTGRGGSGSEAAVEQQQEIIRLLKGVPAP